MLILPQFNYLLTLALEGFLPIILTQNTLFTRGYSLSHNSLHKLIFNFIV